MMMLLPDTTQRAVYEADVAAGLEPGNLLMFAHGFNIHFKQIDPPEGVDVGMVAPKGPGHLVRRTYTEGIGTPSLFAVHRDPTGTATAARRSPTPAGSARAARRSSRPRSPRRPRPTCSASRRCCAAGPARWSRPAFDTLVDAGYQPEIAYFECLHELKLIVDLLYEGGFEFMRYSVSDTAEYGDYTRGPRVVDDATRKEMGQILDDIRSGAFAEEWVAEAKAGYPKFKQMRAGRGRPPHRGGRQASSVR